MATTFYKKSDSISDRDKSIIDDYNNTAMTLREIGSKYGISHERVRQILNANDVERKSIKERRFEHEYINSDIKDFLVGYYGKAGNTPGSKHFYDISEWPRRYIVDEFGGYSNLLAWCELPLPPGSQRVRNYTDKEIKNKICELNKETDEPKLTVEHYRSNRKKFDLPYIGVIFERFGSWNDLLNDLGIETTDSWIPYEKVKKHNDYNLLQKMYYDTVRNNHYPTHNEWDDRFEIPAVTCRKRFNGWRNFQNKAMLKFSKTLNDNNEN